MWQGYYIKLCVHFVSVCLKVQKWTETITFYSTNTMKAGLASLFIPIFRRLDVDQLLNWENDEKDDDDNDKDDNDKNLAPAAATEFASEVSAGGEESSVEPISVGEASVTAPTTTSKPINKSPSVFDIGLSKYGMDALLGKQT